ncbi:DUF4118 domain-containing protein [Luteitalea sp.]|uniref:DUF4118 domain-containing protein n=1 Tax=Luteitalea sp. TaxID=2004800 RepID=UPI0025C555F4|nr:DUF4118 domain-containing protein [Luteitalea sp.]
MATHGRFWPLMAGVGGVVVATVVYVELLDLRNAAIVSTSFLLIVLLVAAWSTLSVALATSVVAMLCFNFFFLPPVGTLTIADPQNWVALGAFLVVSVVASNLSARVRARADEAHERRAELARLYDLSRDVLLTEDSREGIADVARAIARRFDLAFAALALPNGAGAWDVVHAGAHALALPDAALSEALNAARQRLEFDAEARTYAGIARFASAISRSTSCPSGSAPGPSASWRPRATASTPGHSTRLPDWRRWPSSASRCSGSGARPRTRARARPSRRRCWPRSATTSVLP